MKKISLYCDGSSLGNPGNGGWCAILRYEQHERVISGGEKNVTNNQMELKAVIEALKILKEPCDITLYSDSQYVCNGINAWLQNWIQKNFKNVKNPHLWQDYLKLAQSHQIKAHWVKGHAGHAENERCDTIARLEASKLKG
ncbi:ribonuclease HI [Helicobacter kayseriensis]|uniref:ribonuclease HI n=1 Tax=Helicobacter kayseriensis TaxID=2905877 RepID=UPI001E63F42A|nr:ribonuclease HI [Helicobacter kayseriensis]MCE3047662.1 ribonuclease HI [Helicobacter kayseriensis]MCE3048986.1 ribonuclease HI [Helicobacter kayseriensis]